MNAMQSSPISVVALGEILWDVFPDRTCFGGAPANFACATAELGGNQVDVFMVSGIGKDELGQKALNELDSHGVKLDLVQPNKFPTGQVDITLDATGKAVYQFKDNVAWDNLMWSDNLKMAAGNTDAVCFGTLGQRDVESAKVIQEFVASTNKHCLRVFDINLRFPHVRNETVVPSLELCNILKLNDEELPYLAGLVRPSGKNEKEQMEWIRNEFNLKLVAMTLGDKGVLLNANGQSVFIMADSVNIVDTVGAGDSFTAMLTLSILDSDSDSHWNLQKIGSESNRIAGYVCTQPGATPTFPAELKFDFLNH